MPGLLSSGHVSSKKRKRTDIPQIAQSSKKRATTGSSHSDSQSRIESLEKTALESGSKESISALLEFLESPSLDLQQKAIVAVSLCRIFTKLLISGDLKNAMSKQSEDISEYGPSTLYQSYQAHLLRLMKTMNSSQSETFLDLYMRMLKTEAEYSVRNVWKMQAHYRLIETLLKVDEDCPSYRRYIKNYLTIYHDCQYHFFQDLSSSLAKPQPEKILSQSVSMLAGLNEVPEATADLSHRFLPSVQESKKDAITPVRLRKAAEAAWLAVLRQPSLSRPIRKNLLRLITHAIIPWFVRPEQLMDFLTDSYNQGGSDALLALSGLYQLISTKNLDYPSFYPKLYSLLDAQLLHSAYRSRFVRLLQTFLASTHLPANLVASFIKRLARLCLFAPPSAIVTVIPYTYNLLKDNPATTFMLHRTSSMSPFEDPFDAVEPDPQLTNAIDSSLWELETLQSHFHPNVASIARIISQQFTKQQYNLEDFLDHSYSSMIDAELGREMKKLPVIEFKIPKKILTTENDSVLPESGAESTKLALPETASGVVSRLWKFA